MDHENNDMDKKDYATHDRQGMPPLNNEQYLERESINFGQRNDAQPQNHYMMGVQNHAQMNLMRAPYVRPGQQFMQANPAASPKDFAYSQNYYSQNQVYGANAQTQQGFQSQQSGLNMIPSNNMYYRTGTNNAHDQNINADRQMQSPQQTTQARQSEIESAHAQNFTSGSGMVQNTRVDSSGGIPPATSYHQQSQYYHYSQNPGNISQSGHQYLQQTPNANDPDNSSAQTQNMNTPFDNGDSNQNQSTSQNPALSASRLSLGQSKNQVSAQNQMPQLMQTPQSMHQMQNIQQVVPQGIQQGVQQGTQQGLGLNTLQQELNHISSKIAYIVQQIQNTQLNLAQITNTNNPQSANAYQFLSARIHQLKTVYVQLNAQQQQIQRSLMSGGNTPMQSLQMVNPYQQQPQQFSTQNAMLMQQQQQQQMQMQNMQMMQRMPNQQQQYQMRMNPSAHQSPMMLPPGLARFQVPRQIVPGGYMMQGIKGGPQFADIRGGRRGQRMIRRRKKYSSESEEEEEATTSEAESVSQISPSELQTEEAEVRRSTRRQSSRNYIQELVESDNESRTKKENENTMNNQQDLLPFQAIDQGEGKIMLIERILGDKIVSVEPNDEVSVSDISNGHIEEYFIKFKHYSYLHCEWCNLSELKRRDRNALSKVKRYKQRKRDVPFLYLDEDMFNPEYIEIDRILDVKKNIDAITGETSTCYLIKWCGLPYDESTWEFEEVIDEVSIQEFHKRNTYSSDLAAYKPRPNLYQWQKLVKSPEYKNENVLRDYQLEGINWLLYEYYVGTNCILADEMGLGKTIQSISFLVEIFKYGIRGPFLVIAPLSTIGNWYREFLAWSDLNVVVFHGAASSRNIIHRYELYYRDENGNIIPDVCKFEVLITTYEMILSENKFLSTVRWRLAIVDEAHRLKNRKCKLLDNLANIYTEHRVLLTGTPLQNTLDELLSLLNFLDPSRAEALENLISGGKLETNAQVQQIQSFLKPVILRRLKEDVEKNIAPKEETIIEVEMTIIQKKVYRGILERNLSFLSKGSSSTNMPNLMNVMMELRKCCNHPFLINGVEDKIMAEFNSANTSMDRAAIYRKALIESSGKLVLVDKLLPKLRDSGHKMLIFSQMVRVLDLIEEYLVSHGFLFERIDGGVRGNLRQSAIDRFSKPDSDKSVFLLCTKAGGLGINLTAADTVIIFDSDWNPQNDIQAQARCHRIGQNKAVKVYRLICRKTYEREMFDRASLKLGLDKAVLQDINSTMVDEKGKLPGRAQLTKKEVEELLRRGAYAAVMDEDIDASAKFCSEDIEQILERRATVVQIAGEVKGSTFAKASFNAEISGDQVDIDDPDFWSKWAKSAKVTGTAQTDFIDDKPRVRKQMRSIEDDSEVEFTEFDRNRTSRRHQTQVLRTSWFKKECLKVEKNLLVYGWGRWADIHKNGNFKSNVNTYDIEQISKIILVIAWHVCKATDSTYTDFVEKAIRITTLKHRSEFDAEDFNYKPYSKRTRSKKTRESRKKSDKQKPCLYQVSSDWKNVDIDTLVFDTNYKKHLMHCASKILIRLRLLFYIEYYILRDCKDAILSGVNIEEITLQLNEISRTGITLPEWWNHLCDFSIIVGTFKYGYERYAAMKVDPQLCFSKHLNVSKTDVLEESSRKRGRKKKAVPIASDDETHVQTTQEDGTGSSQNVDVSGKAVDMPAQSDLNTLIKRLVTAFWKNRSKGHHSVKVPKVVESKSAKWTKKEEADFYRALTVYGVEYTPEGIIVWDGFRFHGKFEKKDDLSMSQYLDALVQRCLIVMNTNAQPPIVHPSTEIVVSESLLNIDKAEKALRNPEFHSKLKMITSYAELPEWWGFNQDIDLLKASAIYGIDQNDRRVFLDQNLSFIKIITSFHKNLSASNGNFWVISEIIPGVTDVSDPNSLSIDMIKSIIHWPKFKVLINRLYALSTFISTNVWQASFEIKTGNLIEKSRQLACISVPPIPSIDHQKSTLPPIEPKLSTRLTEIQGKTMDFNPKTN